MSLLSHRNTLFDSLTSMGQPERARQPAKSWRDIQPLIQQWWRLQTMGVTRYIQCRIYGKSNVGANVCSQLHRQVNKKISAIDLSSGRFFEDSKYKKKLGSNQLTAATKTLAKVTDTEGDKFRLPEIYWANRGLDSEAFANPANFATRNSKYDNGLHDLSASLLNSDLSIFDQIHNTDQGSHFSFMPLAQPEDQCVMYALVQVAKIMKPYWPEMYPLIRDYRSRMTRGTPAALHLYRGTVAVETAARTPNVER
jgi:hypothetical protein